MYELEFNLPGLPMTRNQVQSKHWQCRHKDTVWWKEQIAAVVAGREPPRPLLLARLELTRYSSGQQMDIDNLYGSWKPVIDGLVTSGILEDDKPAVVTELKCEHFKAKPREGYIKVRVEEIEH